MAAERGAYIHYNPNYRLELDAHRTGASIPFDAPRSNLIMPLRCFNCDFVVNSAKYKTLGKQRHRLMKHETGPSGHGAGPGEYSDEYRCLTPECLKPHDHSMDLRAHCRYMNHLLPKRYCTDVEIDAMSVSASGLHAAVNVPSIQGPYRGTGLLDRLYEERLRMEPDRGAGPQKYRTPDISPDSPSSSGSRRNRHWAHSYEAFPMERDNHPDMRGWARRYHRSRSPPGRILDHWPP